MNILDFAIKYTRQEIKQDFNKEFQSLLKSCKEQNSLVLCFHTLLENYFSFESLKKIIEYDKKGMEDIFNDENTFKWACAFGNSYLIIYLNDKVKEHNLPGAINATFMQYRLDNLRTLELLGYEKEIYTEPNMCQAISRANQQSCGLNIVEYFFDNLEKFPKLSNYVWNEIEKKKWVSECNNGDYFKTFEILINLNSKEIKKEILENTKRLMHTFLSYGNKKFIKKIMESEIKNDFVNNFRKEKDLILKESLSLDKEENFKNTNRILKEYPELIKHEDIKLWMMNDLSYKINDFIIEKRKVSKNEIKKALMTLSTNETKFSKLLKSYPKINFNILKLAESIKIMNNLYEDVRNDQIDYSKDSNYKNLSRKILLKNKDFKNHIEEIKDALSDKEMYEILKIEQMKLSFEEKFPKKEKIEKFKRLKI